MQRWRSLMWCTKVYNYLIVMFFINIQGGHTIWLMTLEMIWTWTTAHIKQPTRIRASSLNILKSIENGLKQCKAYNLLYPKTLVYSQNDLFGSNIGTTVLMGCRISAKNSDLVWSILDFDKFYCCNWPTIETLRYMLFA